jgi:hypothetical protein
LRKRTVLDNGLGRYEAACAAARLAFQRGAAAGYPVGYASLTMPELEIGGVWDEVRALAGLGRCDLAAGRINEADETSGNLWRSSRGSGRPEPLS